MIKIIKILTILSVFLFMGACAGNFKVAGIKLSADNKKKKDKVSIKLDTLKI